MAITQNITDIPKAGKRGIDTRDAFVVKQEAFQDALTDTFVTEINAFIEQANTLETNVNNKEASATQSATTATTKATEAGNSATSALASKNAAKISETNASASEVLADKWANENENIIVQSGKYSAKHYALKAEGYMNMSDAVKLTGNQTIAGVKTFSSSPIVPVPTTNFQSVPLKSTNITVNVGTWQTYTTINQALEYLSGFYPMYKKNGITATINLKAGFVMAEQVLVSGIDLGWITIVGEDAETIVTHTALTTSFYGHYPAFGVNKGGTSPIIGQLFRFNVQKVGGNKHGLMTWGAGSSANILGGKGFIGAGTYGIVATSGSIIDAVGATASNAGDFGILADMGSIINANSANASNAGTHGMFAAAGSIINAQDANASNAGTHGILADRCSIINANSANASNAGTYGIVAYSGSTINAQYAIIQNQTTGAARVVVSDGSHIGATAINTSGGTVTVFNQAVNTLTANGIIYQ